MRAALFALLLVLPTAGCDSGVAQPAGADALLRAELGRYVAGPFPSALPVDGGTPTPVDDAGVGDGGMPGPPTIATVQAINTNVPPGFRGKPVSALASLGARTVAVGLEYSGSDGGDLLPDTGYWLVPVGLVSVDTPGYVDIGFVLDFSIDVPVGPARLLFAAQDGAGRFGPAVALDLQIISDLPVADLVVVLDWTADMDLDLLVRDPAGATLSSRGLITADGTTVRPDAGVPSVPVDSNASCIIDGAREETAIWDAAPVGTYEVFVRATAACGVPSTGWRVRIFRNGAQVGEVTGASYASEVDAPGGGITGAGRLATPFVIPD